MKTYWQRSFIVGLILVVALVLTAQLVAAVPSETEAVAVSATAAGTTDDGLTYDTNDIIIRKTVVVTETSVNSAYTTWYTLFDGDNFGLGPKHAIDAFSIRANGDLGPACALYCVDAIYMSFLQQAIPVPGIPGKVQGEDVVAFTVFNNGGSGGTSVNTVGGGFSMYFDGSDVGLTTTAEKIDGLDVWVPGITSQAEFPYDCSAGILFISTQGDYRVPAANGGSLVGDGNDVLMFCATNLGSDTAGFWFRGFDASDHDWPNAARNAISGLDVESFFPFTPAEQEEDEAAFLLFTFTVKKSFSVPVASGGPSEIFGYPEGCSDTVYGPIDDLNQTEPALNGTVAGYDLLGEFVSSDC